MNQITDERLLDVALEVWKQCGLAKATASINGTDDDTAACGRHYAQAIDILRALLKEAR
jgi:hypothetical protein